MKFSLYLINLLFSSCNLKTKLKQMTYKKLLYILFCVAITVVFACKQKPVNTEQKDETGFGQNEYTDTIDLDNELNEVYYRFPSPNEVFGFIKDAGLKYQPGLVNPSGNNEKYVDSKSQTLNLGVYVADVAYIVLFGKSKEAITYFEAIHNLSDKAHVASAYDQPVIKRIQKNINNIDSLKSISTDAYFSIIDNLVDNEKEKTLAVLSAGAYIECLYIATQSVDKFSDKNMIVQRVADQKYAFENLMNYAEKYKDDANVAATLIELNKLKDLFASLTIDKKKKTEVKENKDGTFVFDGGAKIVINEKQFLALKAKVNEVRKNIIDIH
jgi:hypothetical protein